MTHSEILSLLKTINELEQNDLKKKLREYPDVTYTWWNYDNEEWLVDSYPIISVSHYNMGAVDVAIKSVSLVDGRIEFDAVTNECHVDIDFPAHDVFAGEISLLTEYME